MAFSGGFWYTGSATNLCRGGCKENVENYFYGRRQHGVCPQRAGRRDVHPALRECEIALYDIDGQRLDESYRILSTINQNINEGRAVLKTYLGVENRKEACGAPSLW